jgi:hypothetical protein
MSYASPEAFVDFIVPAGFDSNCSMCGSKKTEFAQYGMSCPALRNTSIQCLSLHHLGVIEQLAVSQKGS